MTEGRDLDALQAEIVTLKKDYNAVVRENLDLLGDQCSMLVEGEMTRNRMIEIAEREMRKNGSHLTADTPTWNAVTVARDSEHEDGCLTSLLQGVYEEGAEAARKEGYDEGYDDGSFVVKECE